MKKLILIMLAWSFSATAQEFDSTAMNKVDGCMSGPTHEFGKYIGDWNILERRLDQDGKWTEHTGTKWNFKCVGNGIAVQDYWLPANGTAGTNLRVYNPSTKSWDIAWTATLTPGLARINAVQHDNGNMVMHYVTEITPKRRITFFPPHKNGWAWQMEIDLEGRGWTKVLELIASNPEDNLLKSGLGR